MPSKVFASNRTLKKSTEAAVVLFEFARTVHIAEGPQVDWFRHMDALTLRPSSLPEACGWCCKCKRICAVVAVTVVLEVKSCVLWFFGLSRICPSSAPVHKDTLSHAVLPQLDHKPNPHTLWLSMYRTFSPIIDVPILEDNVLLEHIVDGYRYS